MRLQCVVASANTLQLVEFLLHCCSVGHHLAELAGFHLLSLWVWGPCPFWVICWLSFPLAGLVLKDFKEKETPAVTSCLVADLTGVTVLSGLSSNASMRLSTKICIDSLLFSDSSSSWTIWETWSDMEDDIVQVDSWFGLLDTRTKWKLWLVKFLAQVLALPHRGENLEARKFKKPLYG